MSILSSVLNHRIWLMKTYSHKTSPPLHKKKKNPDQFMSSLTTLMRSVKFQHTAIITRLETSLIHYGNTSIELGWSLGQRSVGSSVSPCPGNTVETLWGSGEGQVTPLSVMVAGEKVSWKKQEYDSPSSSLGRPGMDREIWGGKGVRVRVI